MRIWWILACMLGEAMGIAVVAAAYAAVERGLLAPAAIWIVAAGAWEGLCLGGAQALVLRTVGVRPGRWVALTVAGAVLGYGLSLAGGTGGEGSGPPGEEPPLWMMAVLGAGLGAVMGVLMGAVQSSGLGGRVTVRAWVAANAIGWAPAMAAIMVAAATAEASQPLVGIALLGAVSGAVAGLSVGIATAFALRRVGAAGSQ